MATRTLTDAYRMFFNWSIAILIAVQFISAWTMPHLRRNETPGYLMNIHMTFGILVMPFLLGLLITHFSRPKPVQKIVTTVSEKFVGGIRLLFYILLVLVPLSGWVYASVHGWVITVFSTIALPVLFSATSTFWIMVSELHVFFSIVLGLMILGHVGVALYHHFVLKDSVLAHMSPRLSKSTALE